MKLLTKATQETTLRTKERTKKHGEVFTPDHLVSQLLDSLEKQHPECFKDSTKTYIDNSCGNGQILVQVLERKINNGINPTIALSTIYGVELQHDNVEETRQRLLEIAGDTPENRQQVNINIVCHDALTWDYENWCSPDPKWNSHNNKVELVEEVHKVAQHIKIQVANSPYSKDIPVKIEEFKTMDGKLTSRQDKTLKKKFFYDNLKTFNDIYIENMRTMNDISYQSNPCN